METFGITKANDIDDDNLSIKHFQRLCHIVKRIDFDGYGFNLHSEKGKSGQYIGKVDNNSPAELSGLKEGDRIIEVNGANIGNETHKQVVQRIKAISSEVRLLVIDPIKEKNILQQEKTSLSATAITTITSSAGTAPSAKPSTPSPPQSGAVAVIPATESPSIMKSSPNIQDDIDNGTIITNDINDQNNIKTSSTIIVQSTKTITTKDNISISSSSSISSGKSSPVTKMKNHNNQQEQQEELSYDNNIDKITPSGIKNYQTNIEFIINENKTIEQINNNNESNNHSNTINNKHHHNNNNLNNKSTDDDNHNDDIKNENLIINNKIINLSESVTNNNNDNNLHSNHDNELSIKTTTTINDTNINNSNNLITASKNITTPLNNDNKKSSLNLPMTAAEMRAKLLSKKKYDPKNDSVDLRKKFEIIQKL